MCDMCMCLYKCTNIIMSRTETHIVIHIERETHIDICIIAEGQESGGQDT